MAGGSHGLRRASFTLRQGMGYLAPGRNDPYESSSPLHGLERPSPCFQGVQACAGTGPVELQNSLHTLSQGGAAQEIFGKVWIWENEMMSEEGGAGRVDGGDEGWGKSQECRGAGEEDGRVEKKGQRTAGGTNPDEPREVDVREWEMKVGGPLQPGRRIRTPCCAKRNDRWAWSQEK